MRRPCFSTIPLLVAAAALVLSAAPARAQQEHDHAAAGQACACCGKSGSDAMNHAAGGGCCGAMAGNASAQAADEHASHQPAQSAAPTAPKAMDHSAGGGCCANMKMDHAASGQAAAKPTEPAAGGCCGSMAMGKGDGRGAVADGGDAAMSDMEVFHFLLENKAAIHRTVHVLPNGVDTLTESDTPEIAAKIKTHVAAMYARLKDGRAIHQRDPLFAEIFAHADQIDANITYTDKGIHVVETSTDPAVAHLLHKHAEVVDGFITNGMAEMMKNHVE